MTHSQTLFTQAQQRIPGGVNSPVRAFKGVGGTPLFIASAKSSTVTDADGKTYIDYVGSWGPMILGHSDPRVVAAVCAQAAKGLSYGAPCALEVELADTVCRLLPSIEQIRFVNSGTEATMSAIRLARGYTGRAKVIKFDGCYHGHSDGLLVKAGSGALTLGTPSSPGVPAAIAHETLVAEFNHLDSVAALFQQHAADIAAIIVEPIAGNMNMVKPSAGFLQGLRALCDQHGSLLIFDEVMTGFRVGLHGAQGLYGITPDLTTLGKVIGGGLPVGAFGGRKAIMQQLAPVGPVYQAGTLSGNPLAMAAGLATLQAIQAPSFFAELTAKTEQLVTGLNAIGQRHGHALCAVSEGGMFGLFMSATPPHDLPHVLQTNAEAFKRLFHHLLQHGVYLAPSAFEAGFVSIAHSVQEIEHTLWAVEAFFHP